MNAVAPPVTMQDVDEFESRFDLFKDAADLDDIVNAVYLASVFIENLVESGGPLVEGKMDQVNNATSTFGRCTRILVNRVRALEKQNADVWKSLETARDVIVELTEKLELAQGDIVDVDA